MSEIRRRGLLNEGEFYEPDAEIPAAWKAVETIQDSWAEIITRCKNGTYKKRYKIGDTKVANFGSEGLCLMHIVGFDCDEKTDGGTAPISWASGHCINTQSAFEAEGNIGGYHDCTLRPVVDNLLNKLPNVLKKGIVEVKKYHFTYVWGQRSLNLKIWPVSGRELGVNASFWTDYETAGPIYQNFPEVPRSTGSTPTSGGYPSAWTRSAKVSTQALRYGIDGKTLHESNAVSDTLAHVKCGIAPCFCTR